MADSKLIADFQRVFHAATGFRDGSGQPIDPYPYQTRLATEDALPQLLDIPTGLGKTAAVILAWLFRRRFNPATRDNTPRRLVYCLPMRTLVEQTRDNVKQWLTNLEMLDSSPGLITNPVGPAAIGLGDLGDLNHHRLAIHLLMGGEDKTEWAHYPERDAILIGTQDMLLSRALNRGYAAGRARWPLEFGFLNSDCLWVFDEVQIMDTGLASSLQLDAWRQTLQLRPARDGFPTANSKHLHLPCPSLWMSATMARHWLDRAVDWSPHAASAWSARRELLANDLSQSHVAALFANRKTVMQGPVATLTVPRTKDSKPDERGYIDCLALQVRDKIPSDGLTLVIVNTVERAVMLYNKLIELGLNKETTKLIHSRFRPIERESWGEFLKARNAAPWVIISTQVIEAGVDISASVLFTEIAPWASLIQRFGRCARFVFPAADGRLQNEHGTIHWMDIANNEHAALPYDARELEEAKRVLQVRDDVNLASLMELRPTLAGQASALFPYEPRFVPREKDLFDLFDTTPDLTGADVDVSRFIRDGEELDIQVFWREVPLGKSPPKRLRPNRRELCPVSFHRFRKHLPALRKAGRIWRRNYRKGWEPIDLHNSDARVYPGQIFLLEKPCGGYSKTIGWTGDPKDMETGMPPEACEPKNEIDDEDGDETDNLSEINKWLTIAEHTSDVCHKLNELLLTSGATPSEQKILRLAARLHDWGKAHPAFRAKLKPDLLEAAKHTGELRGDLAAKGPDGRDPKTNMVDQSKNAWRRDKICRQPGDLPDEQKDRRRPGFRHELASALAILETLYHAKPDHPSFAWPAGLAKATFGDVPNDTPSPDWADDPLMMELIALPADELDLLIYLVAAHHGKVRMSLRSSPDDNRDDVPDPCVSGKRQARGVRDDDAMPSCRLPSADLNSPHETPEVTLSLDLMELGLSPRYGASWRERTQLLLERLGPFQLGYLEALLRAADCRASAEEDERGRGSN